LVYLRRTRSRQEHTLSRLQVAQRDLRESFRFGGTHRAPHVRHPVLERFLHCFRLLRQRPWCDHRFKAGRMRVFSSLGVKENARDRVRVGRTCERISNARKIVVVAPFALDLGKNRTEVHGECHNNELILQTDDPSVDRHRLQLIEGTGNMLDGTKVKIFRHFKAIVVVVREGTG